jgi:hypothetical protein
MRFLGCYLIILVPATVVLALGDNYPRICGYFYQVDNSRAIIYDRPTKMGDLGF